MWTTFYTIVIASLTTSALEYDLLKTIQKKRSVISGVLNPGSVSFNGQEIYNGKESFAALLINKIPVKINVVSGLETFYFSTEDTSLEIEWQSTDGKIIPVLKVEYPSLLEFKTDYSSLIFKFNEHVSDARVDATKINLEAPIYEIENFKKWVQDVHSLELSSKKNTSQIYNLNFADIKKELLTTTSNSYYLGDGPFSANIKPLAIGISKTVVEENGVSLDYGLYYANIYYTMGYGNSTNKVSQATFQFKVRYGYNPYDVNFGGFSFKRLTIGAQGEIVNYKRDSEFSSNLDGELATKVDKWFLQAGPFFRWEPYQFDKWGVFINFDIRIFRTYENLSSDGDYKYFGLSYYY